MRVKAQIKQKPMKIEEALQILQEQFKANPNLKVGLPKGMNNYPDGTSVYMVGAVNEFGSEDGRIPERSYLRSTIKERAPVYKRFIIRETKLILAGKTTTDVMMNKLGLLAQNDVQNKIVTLDSPANAPSTIRAKKSSNPLIDTGHLKNSISYVLNEGDE